MRQRGWTKKWKKQQRIQAKRASHAWWIESGVKRDCPRTRQHPTVGRTEKSEKVLRPRRQYLVGIACWIFLNSAKAGVHHDGGREMRWDDDNAACTPAASHATQHCFSSLLSEKMDEKAEMELCFKSNPGLVKCLANCFFLESIPKHTWVPLAQHKS